MYRDMNRTRNRNGQSDGAGAGAATTSYKHTSTIRHDTTQRRNDAAVVRE